MRATMTCVTPASLALLWLCGTASGQMVTERAVVVAEDAASGDLFGRAVAISGPTALVGAYAKADRGLYSGAAYVYEYTSKSWLEMTRLQADDTASFDRFGWSVGIDNNVIIIGAPTDDDPVASCGNAFIFQRQNGVWVQKAKLAASDADIDDQFGYAVDVEGNVAVIGAHRDDELAFNAGAAYIFRRVNGVWAQEAKLTASDAVTGDSFGAAVAISGDSVVIGAYGQDEQGLESGAAYVFRKNNGGWSQKAKLVASDALPYGAFGFAVDIEGDSIIVGAYGSGEPVYSGRVYVFEKAGAQWIERQRLAAPQPQIDDRFGFSVSLSGDLLLCGAYLEDSPVYNGGAVHVFQRGPAEWKWITRIIPRVQTWAENFGTACAIDGEFAVAGSPRADNPYADSGGGAMFEARDFRDCNGNNVPDFLDILQGFSSDGNGNGVPDECDPEPPCAGDADGDGRTTTSDLILVLTSFGCISQPGAPCSGDVNSDGAVDNVDINIVLSDFGCGL